MSRKMPRVLIACPSLVLQLMLPSRMMLRPSLARNSTSTLGIFSPVFSWANMFAQWLWQQGLITSKMFIEASSSSLYPRVRFQALFT